MPWYRIYASHGAGHQSSTEFYRWFYKPLATKQEREDAWMEVFDNGKSRRARKSDYVVR